MCAIRQHVPVEEYRVLQFLKLHILGPARHLRQHCRWKRLTDSFALNPLDVLDAFGEQP
jgi:hypothetical protein